jgi:hypothetical protein
MIKTNFLVNEDEKARILNLHENATKKLYLVIEDDSDDLSPITQQDLSKKKMDINKGMDFSAENSKNSSIQSWMIENQSKYPRFVKRLNVILTALRNGTNPTDSEYQRVGRYLRKNPEVLDSIESFRRKDPSNLGI